MLPVVQGHNWCSNPVLWTAQLRNKQQQQEQQQSPEQPPSEA
jgi:hypothetical protein